MTTRALILGILFGFAGIASAQQGGTPALRHLTLDEAVALTLEHNHLVRIASSTVDEKQEARTVARGNYFPTVRTDIGAIRLSDTQLVAIPAGGLGAAAGALIPPQTVIINQGAVNSQTAGVGALQPLTQLLKIRAANDIARAEVNVSDAQKR